MGLFGRKRGGGPVTRVYYASDIHGSEVLWRKFLNAAGAYRAGVLIMGGDVTGKVVVPLVEHPDGFHVELFGERHVVASDDVEETEHRIRANGMYPHRMSAGEVARVADLSEAEREAWFADVMRVTFDGWLALADERLEPQTRCFVMPGNDDPPGVDAAIEDAVKVEACDGRVVDLGEGRTMVSLGYANRTPFDSPRELDESELYARVERARRAGRGSVALRLQPARAALRLDARHSGGPHRGPRGDHVGLGAEDDPGGLDGGARAHRALPAAAGSPRPRARERGRDAHRGDAVHQPGQRLPHRTHLGVPAPAARRRRHAPVRHRVSEVAMSPTGFAGRLVDEGRALVAEADGRGLAARLLGGVGIHVRLGPRLDPAFARPYGDLDLVVRKRDGRELERLVEDRGWAPAREFNALNGARRMLFQDPQSDAQIDVFVEAFEMCHTLPLAAALDRPGPGLPATDLLMTKLQIVALNAKDRNDIYALLSACPVGEDDPDAIEPARLATLTARDWGMHHTFELNLVHLRAGVGDGAIPGSRAAAVAATLDALGAAMEAAPKSRGWKLRDRVGERKRWYDDPEEVDRAPE